MTHLDEGTIHAWLDGALGAHDAAEVERHAAQCDECAARVAEARGLIAGASRILSALDDVGAEIVPARTPEVKRKRSRASTTRVVAWLAAAGLLLAVGLESRSRTAGHLAVAPVLKTDTSPIGRVDSLMAVPAGGAAPVAGMQGTTGTMAGNGRIDVKVPRTDTRVAQQSDARKAEPLETGRASSKVENAPASAAKARAALPRPKALDAAGAPASAPPDTTRVTATAAQLMAARRSAAGLVLQDVVVTGVGGATPTELGRVPMCFEELPATSPPAMAPVAAEATRGAAKAAVGATGAVRGGADVASAPSTNQVRVRLASNVLMLDSTPASPGVTGAQAPRLLLNSEGVAGEWQRLGTKGASGNDSLVLRFGQPLVRAMQAELAPEGLKVGARVMVRVRCGGGG